MRPGILQLTALPPLSLYVHIPWCLRKCPYCDFNSHAAQQGALPADLQQRYADALLRDLESSLPLIWGRSVISVFIGGGTPSLFAPGIIGVLLSGIRARMHLLPDCEITLEANPGTFERERFRALHAAGVNRLSIGVQSFNDARLAAIGRVHDVAQARAAVEEAASVFDTFNLDVMYALPGQSLAELAQDMDAALGFAPPHMSIYHLTIEPNTWFARHPPTLPDDDLAWDMLDNITARAAQAGMRRYEVSAYAREGHQCRHNRNYWQFGDYLGIGAGAHGKLSFAHRIIRQARFRDPQRYVQAALDGDAIAQEREVKRGELPFEYMLGALRLCEGFHVSDYMARTGLPASTVRAGLERAQSLELITWTQDHVQPTARGMDFLSDLQSLFLPGAGVANL